MVTFSKAKLSELKAISDFFIESYESMIVDFFGRLPDRKLIEDVLKLYIDTAREGFILAKEKGMIIGFALGVDRVTDLWIKALRPSSILKFLFTARQAFITPPRLGHFFHAHIPIMAVSKKYQNKGVGLKLAQEVFKEFKKKNIKKTYFQIPLNLVDTYVKYGCNLLMKKDKWAIMKKLL